MMNEWWWMNENKSFFNFAETWHICGANTIKFRNFGQNRESGKFSDLSEKSHLRRMFQFMWFWNKFFLFLNFLEVENFPPKWKIYHFLYLGWNLAYSKVRMPKTKFHQSGKFSTKSGKFSTSAECSNSCDFGIKKKIGSGKFSTKAENFALSPFGLKFGTLVGPDAKKKFHQSGKFSTSCKCSNSCNFGRIFFYFFEVENFPLSPFGLKIDTLIGPEFAQASLARAGFSLPRPNREKYESLNPRTYLYIPN